MPSCPIAMPSHTAMVLNSKGVPPAIRMPSFTARAMRFSSLWPGTTSLKELTTPMKGLSIWRSSIPRAFSSERCGARARPRLTESLFIGVRLLPGHHGAQLGPRLFHQVLLLAGTHGVEVRALGLVFKDPVAGKAAVLNLG